MVKSISICAAAFLLVGCNQSYPSKAQAYDACNEWMSGGITVSVSYLKRAYGYGSMKTLSRYCVLEEDTSQFLGYQISEKEIEEFKAADKLYEYGELLKKEPEGKIVKHYRF